MQSHTRSGSPTFFAGWSLMPRRIQWLTFCLGCFAMVLIAGCGRNGSDRVVVEGTVTYRGEPLPSGRIRFVPIKGTKAPLSGADVVGGKYVVDAKGGVPVGTHQVQITAQRVDPKYAGRGDSVPGDFQDVGGPPVEQYIPKRYNVQSELEITIPPDSSGVTKAFDLE